MVRVSDVIYFWSVDMLNWFGEYIEEIKENIYSNFGGWILSRI
jgi:hypothetical protein